MNENTPNFSKAKKDSDTLDDVNHEEQFVVGIYNTLLTIETHLARLANCAEETLELDKADMEAEEEEGDDENGVPKDNA